MKKVLEKLKSKKILLAVISGILLILLNTGLIDLETSDKAHNIVDIVVNMLSILEVVQ